LPLLEPPSIESNQSRSRAACFTSPLRGEVGSHWRDPGEGNPTTDAGCDPLTRNGCARRIHSDLSPTELGFTRVRHYELAEVGYIRLRLGRGGRSLERVQMIWRKNGGHLLRVPGGAS
jgi:hypothetical protein